MEVKKRLGFELHTISNLMKREIDNSVAKLQKELGEDVTITAANGWVIGYLAHNQNKDIFQKDLEEHFSIRRSTVSKTLQLMEAKGYIIRQPVDYDARVKKLTLTKKALVFHKELHKIMYEIENRFLENLTTEETKTLFTILDKIKNTIEK